ncbi:MAG: DUF1559 domain-containing protein [Planctomycetota bacterium]|nr:MAG: DUF1559 domain-containing protein [Planctomycetota bacterium]
MRTRRISFVVTIAALVLLGIGWGYGQGRTVKVVAPETLLPGDAVLMAKVDGALLHAEAFEKTAAHDALVKSGLLGFFEKSFNRVKGLAGPVPVKPYTDALQTIYDHGFSFAVTPGMGDRGPQPWGIAVIHNGAALDKLVSSTLQLVSNGQAKPERKTVGKRIIVRVDVPDSPGVEIGWWVEGKHLAVVVGIDAINQALAVADAKADNVTTNPLWARYSQPTDGALTSFGWLDLAPVRAMFGGMPVPTQSEDNPTTVQEILVALGLDNLNSIGVQGGIKGRSLTSLTTLDAPGERRGLLSLLDQQSITVADLPPLPAKLNSLMATSFDSAAAVNTIFDTAVALEGVLSPDTAIVQSARAEARDRMGMDLVDDLLSSLGSVTCLYNDEAQTGFGIMPAMIVQVKDSEKLQTGLNKLLVELLPQISNGQVNTRVEENEGGKTYHIESIQAGVSPAILVTDEWMCVSFLPQPVRAFEMRLAGQLPQWDAASLPEETTLVMPESFTGLSIIDPRSTYRLIVGLAPVGASLAQAAMVQSHMLPPNSPPVFVISELPPAELVTQPMFPNVSWSTVDENGWTTRTSSSVPGLPIPGGDGGVSSVAVPAVLVALLLPAVQQAREAARRSQSKNNMKQLLLAMHNYHDTFNHFPPGTVPNDDLEVEERLSWMVSILPYMDQAPLYNQVDMKEGYASAANEMPLMVAIPTYMNPSIPPGGGVTHYVGIGGITEEGPTAELPSPVAGIFGYNRATRMRDITDGTSNTFAIAESDGYTGAWAQGGAATIRSLTQQPYIKGADGIGGPAIGGCHFGMADGAVRFVSENTDPQVLEALATMQGGEVVGEF